MVELYSIDRERLLELYDLYPRASEKMQTYAIEQMNFLFYTRQKKHHLHSGNFKRATYRKNQLFLERKINEDDDLAVEIHLLRSDQVATEIDSTIESIYSAVADLESTIFTQMEQLIWKQLSSKKRSDLRQTKVSKQSSFGTPEPQL